VAAVAYVALVRRTAPATAAPVPAGNPQLTMTRQQVLTSIVILIWIVGVVSGRVNVGLGAFVAAAIILAAGAADEVATLKRVPWGVVLMVCGVSVLIAIVEKTGGMDRFTAVLAAIASPRSVNAVIAFVTGVISTYSSTSGVVLPAFLPMAPRLAAQVGGGDPLAIALSINVGSSLVDVSPLSTLGALCVATIASPEASRRLFRQLLLWGLSMTVVGALFCWLFAGAIARW
jgi:di/tricarboxylate transporter